MARPPRNQTAGPSEASLAAAASLAVDLGDNLTSDDEDHQVPEEFRTVSAVRKDAAAKPTSGKRVWIQLEDSDEIPPGGQFIGVNGVGYKLLPGVPAYVPIAICEVLDQAIMSVPVKNPQTLQVIGYRDRLRLPYRVLTNQRRGN